MKAKVLAVAAIAACGVMMTGHAVEPMLGEGTRELGVEGQISDIEGGTEVSLGVRAGRFISDGLEVGVEGSLLYLDSDLGGVDTTTTLLGLSVFSEYNFGSEGSQVVPYVGASAGAGYWMYEVDGGLLRADDSEFVALISGWGGAKYYLTEALAIGAQFQLDAASEDVFDSGDATDWRVVLRTSFYF